jgi:1-pyrroline-5-carboxylate dehydrogenase
MTQHLPRVTYSNIGVDFASVHAHLDELIPEFEAEVLGKAWQATFATGQRETLQSPIGADIALGSFPTSSAADVGAAVKSARAGAKLWNAAPLKERLAFADRWKTVLAEDKYRLGLATLYEIGKSRIEAVGEAEEVVDMIDYYATELKSQGGYVRSMTELVEHETATSVLRPYGVFAVIAPFNFPLALSVGMLSGALLTGNAVVYKPSPGCPLSGLMIADTLRRAGLPEGVFNIVLGGGEVGHQLVTEPGIDGVAFTGSHQTGMSILRHMAKLPHMKPVIAEMGGKNPAYVTRTANLERAAQGVARSAFGLQGQKCSACSVVFVENAVKAAFLEKFVAYASKLTVDDPRKAQTFMGPIYGTATVARYKAAVEQAKAEGKVHSGGTALGGGFAENYVTPAIVELNRPSSLTRDEMFMPFVVVRGVDSLDAAIAEGNAVAYGLSAGIYSSDQSEIDYFLNNAQAGVLYANRASGATTGAWPGSQPFCGWKGSGVGGKGGLGSHYLPQFTREQSHTIMTR